MSACAAATGARLFTARDFRDRANLHRVDEEIGEYGDHRLNPTLKQMLIQQELRDAAVLVPVIDRGDEATVLLTLRSSKLRQHAGQIAFPGGRIDPEDASPEAAALREAEEEVGLDASFVETVGRLPYYYTGTGYRVRPVLSIVKPGFLLTINQDEVDDAFEVPLSFLMNAENHQRDSRYWQNQRRHFFRMPYQNYNIWGVTAGIIHMLYERLYNR
jgi:8-oxo-dGTP pyrophosphatase MutT (NUDIX family)